MSYTTSLLRDYSSSYGPSTLLSDDFVQRSSLIGSYEPSVTYTSPARFLSDNLAYNPIGLNSTSYRSSAYSNLPSTNYRQSSVTNWQRDIPIETSYTSLNNFRNYSENFAPTSTRSIASSAAHVIDENNYNRATNLFPDYRQNYNRLSNDVNRNPNLITIWSSTRPKISTNGQLSPLLTTYAPPTELPLNTLEKKSPIQEIRKDPTPPPPPVVTKQENVTSVEYVDNQRQLNNDDKTDEATDQNRMLIPIDQIQNEKVRPLPSISNSSTKKNDNKTRITSNDKRGESYFDTLFDGNYYRKSTTNRQNSKNSYQSNKSSTNSLNKPKTTIFPKYIPTRKPAQHQPPVVVYASPRKQPPRQQDSITARETLHQETEKRYHAALQKIRSDHAEQEEKQPDSTTKRLEYSDYVRNSTQNELLQHALKPSPWSVFIDTKKGNVYSMNKEEKKTLYHKSKLYGERVRNRNIDIHNMNESMRAQHRASLAPIQNRESPSSYETSNENADKDDDDDSSSSASTKSNKTYTKQTNYSDYKSSSTSHQSEGDDYGTSNFGSKRKQKKKYDDSSYQATTTTATEDSEYDQPSEHPSTRTKYRDTDDDDLSTLHEEKSQESIRDPRHKKR